MDVKDVGIVMHSAEGALLCYRAAVFEGIARLGAHNHPTITMSGTPNWLAATLREEYVPPDVLTVSVVPPVSVMRWALVYRWTGSR